MLHHQHADPRLPSRAVLLGGNGFLGRRLTRRLAATGVEVLALGTGDLDLTAGDAADRLAGLLRPNDAVVMLAALTPDRGRDTATLMRNLAMADAVCQALAGGAPAHVVYISSDAVYPFGSALVTEESCAEAEDLYGIMHRAREVIMRSNVKAPLAILRPTLLFGHDDPHNSYGPNRFRRMAAEKGEITLFGGGEETRDHVYADDAVALIDLVLQHRSTGILNLASGTSLSFDDAARAVAATFDRPVKVIHTPRQNPITHRHFDVTALLKAFPAFRFTPLADGVALAR